MGGFLRRRARIQYFHFRLWIQSKFEKEFGKLRTGQVVLMEQVPMESSDDDEEEDEDSDGELGFRVPGEIV